MGDLKIGKQVRTLTAEDLGVGYVDSALQNRAASVPDAPIIDRNDPQILEIIKLLRRYSGVILSGAPGTSKSYFASAVGKVMTDGEDHRLAFAQFHASYQYEDFMEGFRPDEEGGFTLANGVFLSLCERAGKDPRKDYVMVIDELSRGDVGRVFGEALTYVERSKRSMEFTLPSGNPCNIPPNVFLIATMNPLDRGVDEVDAAFERRFAKVEMPPDSDTLDRRLQENEVADDLRTSLLDWFQRINGQSREVPAAALGHAYFWDVTNEATARDAWKYQVQHHVNRAFRYDVAARDDLINAWERIFTGTTSRGE